METMTSSSHIGASESPQAAPDWEAEAIARADAAFALDADILEGVRFSATLHVSTPLSVLQHHGEIFKGPPSRAPKYGNMAQGTWIPQTKSLESLGIDLPELKTLMTHASDVGPVEPNQYLPFLIAFRTIFETDGPDEVKLLHLAELGSAGSDQFRKFWKTLEKNIQDFPRRLFYIPFCRLKGVGVTTARKLYAAGFRSIDQILGSTPETLSRLPGIGPALAARILAASAPPPG